MNEPQKKPPDRVPIRIERLVFSSANPYGVKVPEGIEGRGERIVPHLTAGVHGDVKIEIDFRPWLRVFRVTKSRRIAQTEGGKSIESWMPMGKPFHIPETWAVAVLAED